MLKYILNFRTRGVRCFVCGGATRPNVYLASAWYYDASEEEYGGLMVIFICMDISVIFLSSIALDLGHKRLVLDLEFAAVDLRGVDSLTGHLFALSFSCIFCSFSCIAYIVREMCFIVGKKVPICICVCWLNPKNCTCTQLIVLYWLCIKFTDSICIQKFVMYIREDKI